MFGNNLQNSRMMPMTRQMSGAPNNIQPGMRAMAAPTQVAAMPRPVASAPMQRPMMMANALRGQMR